MSDRHLTLTDQLPGQGRYLSAFVELPAGSRAGALVDALAADERLALVRIAVDRPGRPSDAAAEVSTRLDPLLERCRRLGLDTTTCDGLRSSILGADTATAHSLVTIVQLVLDGAPFLLIRPGAAADNPLTLPHRFAGAIEELFGLSVIRLSDPAESASLTLRRRPPVELRLASDRELLAVLLSPDEELAQSWTRWLERATVDEQHGIMAVAPILQERLAGIGVDDEETGRLTGIRRRTWYTNSLKRADTIAAIDRLREIGIAPVLTGDIIDALEAEKSGSVRMITEPSLVVPIGEIARGLEVLEPICGPMHGPRTLRPEILNRRSAVSLTIDTGRSLSLQWRWLPDRAADLVPLDAECLEEISLDAVTVATLSPGARFVDLCADRVPLRPGRTLALSIRAFELIDRHHGRIDWEWTQWALERLQLTAHAQLLLATVPEQLRASIPVPR